MKPRQTNHQIKWPYLPTFHLPHPKIGSSEIREVSGPSSAWRRIARLSVPCPESTWCHEGVVVSEGIPQGFPVVPCCNMDDLAHFWFWLAGLPLDN